MGKQSLIAALAGTVAAEALPMGVALFKQGRDEFNRGRAEGPDGDQRDALGKVIVGAAVTCAAFHLVERAARIEHKRTELVTVDNAVARLVAVLGEDSNPFESPRSEPTQRDQWHGPASSSPTPPPAQPPRDDAPAAQPPSNAAAGPGAAPKRPARPRSRGMQF